MAWMNQVPAFIRKRAHRLFGLALRSPRTGRTGTLIALGLVGLLLSGGLFYVWTRMQLLQIGYEIADMEKNNNALKNRKRELLLEITSLQYPADLEKQARERAGLVFPDMGKVVHVP
jgi:cell division protein FtsL